MITFHELYRQYARDVYRFAYYLSGNRELAEDITSETFVRAWQASNRLRIQTVKAYLLAIARNLYLEERRKSGGHTGLDPGLADPAASPLDLAASRSELDRVHTFLQTIPEIDRSVFLMRVQDELSYEEIARIHEISVASAKVKVHRLRLKLNQQREKYEQRHP